jgi:prepilin peptidase CpaA
MLQPLTNPLMIGALVTLLGLALISDLRSRRIPNRLVVYGLMIGCTGNAWLFGWAGCLFSLGGAVVGLLCLLPFYATGSLGAGDVKLMGMSGAFLGPVVVIAAAAGSLVAGGIFGLGLYLWYFTSDTVGQDQVNAVPSNSLAAAKSGASAFPSVPYAAAISAGVLIALAALPQLSSFLGGAF